MARERHNHPLFDNELQINERSVMVFDNVHSMPMYKEPYISPYLTITLNIKGWVHAEYDMQNITFNRGEIAIVHPNHQLCALDSSKDYHAILLVMSPKMEREIKKIIPSMYLELSNYIWNPHFHLTEEQFNNVYRIMKLLQGISMEEEGRREVILKGLIHILGLMLQDYRQKNGIANRPPSPHAELFTRFYEAIIEHYCESREVNFYANLFCLTPKHFASVIKQQTGINAHEWINNYVILQAKSKLKYQKLNIQQVAQQLGFSEQAAFSRFFRNATGMTPSEFKNT